MSHLTSDQRVSNANPLRCTSKNQGCGSKSNYRVLPRPILCGLQFQTSYTKQVTDDSVNFPTSAQIVILMSWRFHSESHQLQLVWGWPDLVPVGMYDPSASVPAIFCPLTYAPNILLTVLHLIFRGIVYSESTDLHWRQFSASAMLPLYWCRQLSLQTIPDV